MGPGVSGVITDELQAPLGHISVLCHNHNAERALPRGARQREVKARARRAWSPDGGAGYRREPATRRRRMHRGVGDAGQWLPSRAPRPGVAGLRSLGGLGLRDIALAGANDVAAAFAATLLAARRHAAGLRAAVSAYARFLRETGLKPMVEALLAYRSCPEGPACACVPLDRVSGPR